MQRYEFFPTWSKKIRTTFQHKINRHPTAPPPNTSLARPFLYCLHIVYILFLYLQYRNNIRTICKLYKNNIRTAVFGTYPVRFRSPVNVPLPGHGVQCLQRRISRCGMCIYGVDIPPEVEKFMLFIVDISFLFCIFAR